ncbi:hypothetical protein, partial [Pseudomonas savastanoi]|uniref:hypothetical protein n=4 Tax=Pseudomonas savastanoi TaxID=29438 RepID=UPI001F3ACCC3
LDAPRPVFDAMRESDHTALSYSTAPDYHVATHPADATHGPPPATYRVVVAHCRTGLDHPCREKRRPELQGSMGRH